MKTRLARIIAQSVDDQGRISREEVYRALSLDPDDPVAITIEAVIEIKETERGLRNAFAGQVKSAEDTFERCVAQADAMQSTHAEHMERYAAAALELASRLETLTQQATDKHGERLSQIAALHAELEQTAAAVHEGRRIVRVVSLALALLWGALFGAAVALAIVYFHHS